MPFNEATLKELKLSLSNDNSHVVIRSGAPRREEAEYSFGIEEEYFLADAKTLDVAHTTPDQLFEAVNWSTGGQAMREMLQAQLEVATNVHASVRDAAEELKFLRQEAATAAAQFGLAIMACGTHPTALWRDSQLSSKARYQEMIEDLRIVGQRNMLCGMHVHVQIPNAARRVQVMRAMIPYIPLFIALSTSSPFWNSRATGLMGIGLQPMMRCLEPACRSCFEMMPSTSRMSRHWSHQALCQTKVIFGGQCAHRRDIRPWN